MSEYQLRFKDLDCADCAAKLEGKIKELSSVQDCTVNFMNVTCTYSCDPTQQKETEQQIRTIVGNMEPDVTVETIADEEVVEEEEEEEDSKKQLILIILGAILFAASWVTSGTISTILVILSYAILGYQVIWKALRNIAHGNFFDENFLMALASLAALFLKDYREAAAVMLFYQIGEYFQDRAVENSKKSITSLMSIRPDKAMVLRDGEYVEVTPQEVSEGDILQVKPGERIPLDGIVVEGSSSLDTSSLTGEAKPRDIDPNDEVLSGCVNQTGLITLKVTRPYAQSTVSKILDMVQNSQNKKAKTEKFITKFSRVYTPAVVLSAVVMVVILLLLGNDVNDAIYRACTFLVISCPCALVISIPLSFFAGIGGLSKRGVLVKGSNIVETLANVQQVVFDKTGTITSGSFVVEEVIGNNQTLEDAAWVEASSNHPIAQSICKAYGKEMDLQKVSQVEEIPGRGLKAVVDGHTILAGNAKMMKDASVSFSPVSKQGTIVYVAKDQTYEGAIVIVDAVKPDSAAAIQSLKNMNQRCVMMSGDNPEITQAIAHQVHMDEAFGGCLPDEKATHVEEIKKKGCTAFAGDGVNDAPVLALADVGIAMGGLGSDAAIEAADVVIMDDSLTKIPLAISASKRILSVAKFNIWFAIGIKLAILVCGALGVANMWMAIFADVGVAFLCILNSMRLLRLGQ